MLSNRRRSGGNAAKRASRVTLAPNRSDDWIFRAHIIRMPNPESLLNPTVRILLVGVNRIKAVYEGWGPVSTFQDWIDQHLSHSPRRYKRTMLDAYISKAQFSTVRNARVSLRELRSYGFVRVDKVTGSASQRP